MPSRIDDANIIRAHGNLPTEPHAANIKSISAVFEKPIIEALHRRASDTEC